ncbi:helix-turn-helix domain-containing protein [Streptomyces sp. MBT56]|uniref:helix-turn-helix domain-containing protein n=1 Tax=unclassified Streptomyces TaxID=2593676 RepID=UPI00190A5BAC|nr:MULTISPECIES: helix-turn-helix domain-containing protein [unclassified Streptomyces]MBK3555995.1 helix-turn-helix domain-containing protein [Streptomyces sp. MBT56]MBK3605486.1 helix-turn-helix domain-containing protein [Streptomyces sp. MBT54]MBK3615656.1 helix-turn-helix domain-containing protein [Streptomyces sp. MBT98]
MSSAVQLPSTHQAVTVAEAMVALRISRPKVYDLIRSGALPSFTIGRARRIPADSLHRFIHNQIEEAA